MSLYDCALEESALQNSRVVTVWDWVRSNMDFVKFRRRVQYANATKTNVKVVLTEYDTRCYIPGTRLRSSSINADALDYLHHVIAGYRSDVVVYTRRKIVDGVPHEHIRQLVVLFNADTDY